MFNFLIVLISDTNLQNNNGDTALICAVRIQRVEAVKRLLDNRANVHIQNKNKKTALTYAREVNNLEIITLLVEHGANDSM
ncbi:MAG: ankyrin repeat domain-containing protein [Endozoicomonadaceae bacterium]|nr:ankyrin repeat domain-containing protein [Endozoicomonadaceae bacterium]